MDKISSMFSLQHDDDFLLENPSFSVTYSDLIIPQDPGIDRAFSRSAKVEGNIIDINDKGKRKCKSYDKYPKEELRKKIVHRDVERLRRQEMANLYDSLRSALPHEYLKGKRSISDHIHEAASYIRYMQNNMEELEFRRDKLKKLLNEQNLKTRSCKKTSHVKVTVKSCTVGIEVSITGDFTMEGFPLSSLMQILLEEGLNVISCICTKADGKSHYTIQSEVVDFPGVNLDTLQQKLCHTINHWMDFF